MMDSPQLHNIAERCNISLSHMLGEGKEGICPFIGTLKQSILLSNPSPVLPMNRLQSH